MADDPLDKPVSVSFELTERGVQGAAHSRAVAAFDRLAGNLGDLINPLLEGPIRRQRAQIEVDVRIIEAEGEKRLALIELETARTRLALQQELTAAERRLDNKTGVVVKALEELSENPPTEAQATAGAPQLDSDFLCRFERFAEDATSDAIRERWGRVLASEIRAPGTVTRKVMRLIDELAPDTALLFEAFAQSRLGNLVPKGTARALDFAETTALVDAGLLVDPGYSGQVMRGDNVTSSLGGTYEYIRFEDYALGFIGPMAIRDGPHNQYLRFDPPGRPVVLVYVLTEAGRSIASILPNHEKEAAAALVNGIFETMTAGAIQEFHYDGSDQKTLVRELTRSSTGA